ncbi:MAG: hypothetical protein IPN95_23850 [Bacteroidetes bacterium]|nr:hypothetical protein [Bacteroidota bacterium]MBP6720695.1 hypothetical protein [Bacteroidia bacterium]
MWLGVVYGDVGMGFVVFFGTAGFGLWIALFFGQCKFNGMVRLMFCIIFVLGLLGSLGGDLCIGGCSLEGRLLQGTNRIKEQLDMDEEAVLERQTAKVEPYIGIMVEGFNLNDSSVWNKFISFTSSLGLTLNNAQSEYLHKRGYTRFLFAFDVDSSKVSLRKDMLFSKLRENREMIKYVGVFTNDNIFVFDEIGFSTNHPLEARDMELFSKHDLVYIKSFSSPNFFIHYCRGPADGGSLILETIDSMRLLPEFIDCFSPSLLNKSY